MTDPGPVLWHIRVSHYSEKARWALDYKSVAHERRAPLPGAHMLVSMGLTRGRSNTLPVMRIDGEVVPDSTAIIAALERRFPDPPLYPADPDERRRALELEEFFDEHLGPWIRLVAWHDLRADPQRMGAVTERMVPGAMRPFGPARAGARWFGTTFVNLRYGARSDGAAEAARLRVVEALDRLERELDADGGEFLAGDAFSVADLTAAALFYPLVRPPEGPQVIQEMPATFEEWRAPLRERRGYRWVEQTFARHRHRRRAPVLV